MKLLVTLRVVFRRMWTQGHQLESGRLDWLAKVATSAYYFRHVCPSACLSAYFTG
jgi:hypothetical protein